MGRLVTLGITSLDGHVADSDGSFAWAEPDEELHRYCNAIEATIGTQLYGRRTYELMTYWADPPADAPEVELDYAAAWQDSDKVVVSTTLDAVSTPRTTLWRSFDAEAVAALKAGTERDISISGPTLAAAAFRAGLVDEVGVVLLPVTVGGGTPYLPSGVRLDLELVDEHRFTGGAVHLRYAVRR
jgi:dihydrofolate reductase